DDLGNFTAQDLVDFNAAVRGLEPVALLDADEQPVWNTTNIGNDQFLAVGPTTASDVHCFGEIDTIDRWCFQVVSGGASHFFLAEAKADQDLGNLGACAGTFAFDCEEDVVHIDVNPDEAIFEVPVDDPATKVHVWSCVVFANGHARFGDGQDGFGAEGPPAPAALGTCGDAPSALSGVQRWVWAGLKPLRWAAGVGTLNAGGTGTTFARGSDISEGEEGSIRVRDVVCRTTARFASISDGAECRLFLNSSLDPIPGGVGTTDTECTTVGIGKKTGECTWQDIPVPDDICYYAVVDKQDQTGTAHHAEGEVCVGPGDPAREGEQRICGVNLTTGVVSCATSAS
ncbi:MAG TPA: hypothetical protein VFG78_10990, partial [Gemmatimonadota bacterium]|nr:hypothetical protein [Gemmatimonadota bacterium]